MREHGVPVPAGLPGTNGVLMPGRSRRRADLERMKAKADRISRQNGAQGNWAKLYNHLAHCSGPCCGNPRRWFREPTMQERRFACTPA